MNIKLKDEDKVKVLNARDVYAIMQKILLRENKIDQEKEHFWLIGLATSNKILFIELVGLGSVRATNIQPMNVFRVAVLKGAVKVILVHNHPSGELTPSEEDKNVTDRLIQVGRILDIHVIDHLIITPEGYLSFQDVGVFEELLHSLAWVPAYEIVATVKKEEEKIRNEAVQSSRDERTVEMAKAMKQNGIDSATIADVSGLPEEDIKAL